MRRQRGKRDCKREGRPAAKPVPAKAGRYGPQISFVQIAECAEPAVLSSEFREPAAQNTDGKPAPGTDTLTVNSRPVGFCAMTDRS